MIPTTIGNALNNHYTLQEAYGVHIRVRRLHSALCRQDEKSSDYSANGVAHGARLQ